MPTALPLRPWEIASVIFFAYLAAAALAVPGLTGPRRRQAWVAAAAGLGLTALSIWLSDTPVLHDWLLPPALLLLAYWASGRLFVRPMPRVERSLMRLDGWLRVSAVAARMPRPIVELLEVSYAGVYPLIPIALVIYLFATAAPDPARFWTVILVTDYVCFGVLPWVQTRPPRALEPAPPWRSRFRPLNLGMLGATSIQVNTFPSGHTAEALAAALLVASAPWPYAVVMFAAAVAISAAAVGGRYHYAADAILGWAVALVVWTVGT
jgi:hypothetical protein